jgi:hypothetical protein
LAGRDWKSSVALSSFISILWQPVEEMPLLVRLYMPLLPQLMKVQNILGQTPRHISNSWFPNFTERAIGILEEEHFLQETIKWMNIVAEKLQS